MIHSNSFIISSPNKKSKAKSKKERKNPLYCALELTSNPSKNLIQKNVSSPISTKENSSSKSSSRIHLQFIDSPVSKEDNKISKQGNKTCNQEIEEDVFSFLKEKSKLEQSPLLKEVKQTVSEVIDLDFEETLNDLDNLNKFPNNVQSKKLKRYIIDESETIRTEGEKRIKQEIFTQKENQLGYYVNQIPLKLIITPPSTKINNKTHPRNRKSFSHEEEVKKRLNKALNEKIILLDEKRIHGPELAAQYTVVGYSGKSYIVYIKKNSSCTCPDNLGGKSLNHCKHILFVLTKVLNVNINDNCLYQKELCQEKLIEIFFPEPKNLEEDRGSQNDIDVEDYNNLEAFEKHDQKELIENTEEKDQDLIEFDQIKQRISDDSVVVPNQINQFKPGIHISKDSISSTKTPQEYLCRDYKKPFCRKGDHDNHETLTEHRCRKGISIKLNYET